MFNGGKLYHVFKTAPSESNPRSLVYTNEFTSDHAKEALYSGTKLLKVDGECSALHKEKLISSADNGTSEDRETSADKFEWVFYRRQDNYKGPSIPLPDGKQPSLYDQGGKSHSYSFLKLDPSLVTGKGKKKSYPGPDTYASIEKAVSSGDLPNPNDPDCPEWITTEWMGSKHQTNADGIKYEHVLVPHTSKFLPELTFSSLDEFRQLADKLCFEGCVLIHPDGTRYKMRTEMTVEKSIWSQKCKNKKPNDPGVTDYRPQVLTKDGKIQWDGQEWVM